MPDHAHVREALRRLVRSLTVSDPRRGSEVDTWEGLCDSLDSDETRDLHLVFAFIDDEARTHPRFIYAEKDRDYKTGAARGYVVLDLVSVDDHSHEADLFAACPSQVNARTLVETLNTHPPQAAPTPAGYDDEPF